MAGRNAVWIVGLCALAVGCAPQKAPANANAKADTAQSGAAAAADGLDAALSHRASIARDASTPDRALETIWAIAEADAAVRCAAQTDLSRSSDPRDKKILAAIQHASTYTDLLQGVTLKQIDFYNQDAVQCGNRTYDREINDVKVETDSRAVVLATTRDVTPAPAGFTEPSYDKDTREKGDQFKYVFTKVAGKWLLEEVYSVTEGLPEHRYFEGKPTFVRIAPPL